MRVQLTPISGEPAGGLQVRGDHRGVVRRSTYTSASMHPLATGAMAVGAGLLLTRMLRGDGGPARRSTVRLDR
jgi:hypothetical protein